MPETSNNIERTGLRDATVSDRLRKVPGLKHLDIDGVQFCEQCYALGYTAWEWVAEYTTAEVKAVRIVEDTAIELKCAGLLIQHRPNDLQYEFPVLLTPLTTLIGEFIPPTRRETRSMSWAEFDEHITWIHNEHVLRTDRHCGDGLCNPNAISESWRKRLAI